MTKTESAIVPLLWEKNWIQITHYNDKGLRIECMGYTIDILDIKAIVKESSARYHFGA